jgi:hypothetical protein
MFKSYMAFKVSLLLGLVGTVRAVEGDGVRRVLGVDVVFHMT